MLRKGAGFFLFTLHGSFRVVRLGVSVFVKGKHPMPTGTVKFFNSTKGYGFIAPDNGGEDSFVHISAVERAGLGTLTQNQRVSYEVEADNRGKQSAVNLEAL